MNFDTKRLSQLAGITGPGLDIESESYDMSSQPRRLDERRVPAGTDTGDERQLRLIIRKEARKMIQERLFRQKSVDLHALQKKKSLTEAIAMGFAGPGFGSNDHVLGGPLTSAPGVASRGCASDEAEFEEDRTGLEPDHDRVEFDVDRWVSLAGPRLR